ncbi:MAG TPA: adenosine deaminase [Gemmatimonadales bacterium]|nr:adenosine deaminase [Gemmatimonadales bacterium]
MTTKTPRGPDLTRDLIRRMPKPELHVHLDGSLRPTTLVELAREQKVKLPTTDLAELTHYLHVHDARNLMDYLARFEVTLSVLQAPEALERVTYELVQDGAADGVRYMEIRYSPILCTKKGMPLTEAVEAPLRGMHRAEKDFGVKTGLIICGIRNMSPATSMDLANLTVAFKGKGVVAFDLAGAEYNYPAKKHREAFYTVVNANVAATIHAGEAYGPESIAQALHYCHADRIGHGTRLFEDADLERYVNDRRVPLEVCVTCNVQTHAVASIEQHPVRRYFDLGIVVCLNTDNRLMSATTVTDEYWLAHTKLGFSREEIERMILYGFESAFLPYQERARLVEQAKLDLEKLRN